MVVLEVTDCYQDLEHEDWASQVAHTISWQHVPVQVQKHGLPPGCVIALPTIEEHFKVTCRNPLTNPRTFFIRVASAFRRVPERLDGCA